jgi:thiol:disulfide interchange protein/DsbC/DsbD-like thiol-disulfide interchange protein
VFLISRVLPLRAGLRATRNQKHFRPICDKLLEEDQGSCALNRLTTEGDRLEEKVIAMRELLFRAVRFAGLLMCLAVLWRESAEAQLYNGKELVRPSLIADVDSIQPGQKFRVGVLYRIEPGWHIYWRYSGDSGIPTKIQWQFPEGFKVHDLQWPLPLRDKEPGDLEVFGYVSEVLLFADVEAPANLPAGPVSIQAKTDWLVCQNLCVPGHAQLSLNLNTGANAASDSAQIFQKYASLIPKELPATMKIGFSRVGKNLELSVAGVPGSGSLDFFPIPPSDAVIGHVVREGNTLTLSIETEVQPIKRMDGVLVVGSGENRDGYEINDHSIIAAATAGGDTASVGLAGLLQALGFAMIGGLILNVMPCVLPVISLKIFGFVSEAGERPERAFWLSMVFSLGILSCFALLAVIVVLLRMAGAQVGWGFQFQDYRFIVFISCLVFAFALNLFGVYELSVSWQATRGLAKLASGQGYGGAFFQGVFATILATPCTAPFLGTASAFAFAQPGWVTFLVFLFIGLGMALPYLLLAINPKWLRHLPKPGDWMLRLKQVMGFLLVATLLWLVWILGQMRGADAIVGLGALLLIIAILAWIKGSFWTPISSLRTRMLAAVSMLCVLLLAAGAYGFVTRPSQLVWQQFSQATLDKALASGRPVFIDFTADWCITCKTNERFALDTPKVRQEFSKRNVIALKADWTKGDPEITEILKKHGRAGVPMYLVYPSGSKETEPVLLPELITSQTVLDALNKT